MDVALLALAGVSHCVKARACRQSRMFERHKRVTSEARKVKPLSRREAGNRKQEESVRVASPENRHCTSVSFLGSAHEPTTTLPVLLATSSPRLFFILDLSTLDLSFSVLILGCRLPSTARFAQSTVRSFASLSYAAQYSSHMLFLACSSIDAIDTGSNKSAIVACNKLLKKQPKNDLVKVCDCCT